jgi:E3 ubiquitin-protein ligase MARCH6
VCRCEGTPDRPLFHPCICTGSIKFIHQECLVQWLRYSKKEFCELCNYRFSFTPIYSPDMPKRIPLRLVLSGLVGTVGRAVKFWLHYTLVAVAWLGVVPLTACRIYRTLFTGSVSTILSLPIIVFSTENIVSDILQGCAVVTLTLLAFIGLVWLREQILHGGGPVWLEPEEGEARAAGPAPGPIVQGEAGPEAEEEGPAEEPREPAAPEIVEPGQEAEVPGEGDQWNPMEWDRAAEELTWERLLGLDGSLVFLEHVFWVVSLNTLFILVFAFCPYHIGHFTMMGLKVKAGNSGLHFSGLLITMTGYCMIGIILALLHAFASILRFRRSARALGLCYVVVKVALLLVAEILAFPVICGWWLDVCSLSLFDATLRDRVQSFHAAPWASVFIHWLVGMVLCAAPCGNV